MNSPLRHQRMRITAIAMLFVWMLTLGAGIANACSLHDDHARNGHIGYGNADLPPSSDTESGAQHAAQAAVPLGTFDQDRSLDTIACQSFCSAIQTGMAKKRAGAVADLHTDAVLVSVQWEAAPPADCICEPTSLADLAWPKLPVFIRFMRLTL